MAQISSAKQKKIDALEIEFRDSETMRVEDRNKRYAAIMAAPDMPEIVIEPTKSDAPRAAADSKPVFHGFLARVVEMISRETRKAMDGRMAPILARDEALEAQLKQAAATIESLERRASRHADHLSRLESRLKSLEHN